MFKKSGNICILEKKTTIDPFTHALKDETNEVLNVARHDIKENVTLFVTNTKFYELLFLRGEEGLSEAFIKEYFETEELEDLLQIVHNGLNRNIYKLWFAFYSNLENCIHKQFKIERADFSFKPNVLEHFKGPFDQLFSKNFTENSINDRVLQNGLYDFRNTFIQKLGTILDYKVMESIIHEKNLVIETLKRESNEIQLNADIWELDKEKIIQMSSKEEYNKLYYYTRVIRFLLKNNYISYNYLFCKK